MKKLIEYCNDNFFPILFFIAIIALIITIIIGEYQFAVADNNELEKECYSFYQENNYILEECNRYENKLKGMKD